MSETLLQARVEAIRRLTRRGASGPLSRVLEKSRIEDVAAALTHLTPAEQRRLFRQVVDDEEAAELRRLEAELPADTQDSEEEREEIHQSLRRRRTEALLALATRIWGPATSSQATEPPAAVDAGHEP